MVEPYGILQVCTTSFKVAQALHGFIVHLREVPNELLALSNEVCNLKFVLDSVQKAMHDNEKLGASQFASGDSVQIGKIDRVFWLKEKKKIWELQKQLREIRQGLCVLLGAGNSSALAQLAVDVQNLYAETVRSSDAQLKSQAESQQSLEAISRRIDSIEEIYRDSQDGMTHLQNLCLSLAAKPAQETRQDPSRNVVSNPIQSDSTTLRSTQQETLQHAEEESSRNQRLAFHE
ncbi:MAG: hypothetical protein Q9214_004351, partial [Letrouitia sp. 1 TL-2023]